MDTKKKTILLVGLNVAAALILIPLLRVPERVEGSGLGGMVTEAATQAAQGGSRDLLGGGDDAQRNVGPAGASHAAAAPNAAALPTGDCIVGGRLIEPGGAPVVGAQVILSSYGDWATGYAIPLLPGEVKRIGFPTRSDAEGRFRFAVPAPDAAVATLRVEPDRFHDVYEQRFGLREDCAAPLVAGQRDLGDLVLVATGAVRGRVTDAQGNPLPDVVLDLGPRPSVTVGRDGFSDAEGRFEILHAPVGTFGVSARLQGYLRVFHPDVEVVAGRNTDDVQIVLERAPTIEGLVVDDGGMPQADAAVLGNAVDAGQVVTGRSDASGRFRLELPVEGSYEITAIKDGFAEGAAEGGPAAAGVQDVRVVMPRLQETEILVIDGRTELPIERFAIGIENEGFLNGAKNKLVEEHHPGGRVRLPAEPGKNRYRVEAEGYLTSRGQVHWEDPALHQQTIRLVRGANVAGRVLRDGAPATGVQVRVASVRPIFERNAGPQEPEIKGYREDGDVREVTQTDREGRFAFRNLDRRLLQVTAQPIEGAPLILEPFKPNRNPDHDLGDLVLQEGAVLVGQVLLPPGVDGEGTPVHIGDLRGAPQTQLDANLRFEIRNLPAGDCTVILGGKAGALVEGAQLQTRVEPGQTREVTLDARDFGLCAVQLKVTLNGEVVPRALVHLHQVADRMDRERLGECDEEGWVRGNVRARGRVHVSFFRGGTQLYSEEVLELAGTSEVNAAMDFQTTSVRLHLPAGQAWPQEGYVVVTCQQVGDPESKVTIRERILSGALDNKMGSGNSLEQGALVVGMLKPGSWQGTVAIGRTMSAEEASQAAPIDSP
ncbi:MAG: carboxypeptidase-like regulatory domain-containing protein [Planctomycetota bacterium]